MTNKIKKELGIKIKNGKWFANITFLTTSYSLGFFDTKTEALNAFKEAIERRKEVKKKWQKLKVYLQYGFNTDENI